MQKNTLDKLHTCARGVLDTFFGTKTDKPQDIARRQYYDKLLLMWFAVFACTVLSIVMLKQYEMILICLGFGIIIFGVMIEYEYRLLDNEYIVAYARCVKQELDTNALIPAGVRKKINSTQTRWIYTFEGYIDTGEVCNITLKRSAQYGLKKGKCYMLTFRAKNSNECNDETLVTFCALQDTDIADIQTQHERKKQRAKILSSFDGGAENIEAEEDWSQSTTRH